MSHESTQSRLAYLESKLAAADAAATHLAQECADKTFRIEQLEELLRAALSDVEQYKAMGAKVATDAALSLGDCIDAIVTELTVARLALRRGYELNQKLQVILPDQEQLQACHEELDEQTTILRDGYRRLDDWINGNDEDVMLPQTGENPESHVGGHLLVSVEGKA